MSHKPSWSECDDALLRSKWGRVDVKEIARLLNRHYDAVRNHAHMLGLTRVGGCIVHKKTDEECMRRWRSELGSVNCRYGATDEAIAEWCKMNPVERHLLVFTLKGYGGVKS